MNILTVIQRYYPVIGGSENLTKNLMDFVSKNHQVTVFTTSADDIQSFWYAKSKKILNSPSLNYKVKIFDFLIPSQIKHQKILSKFPFPTNHPGPFSPKIWNDLVIEKIDFDLIFATSYPYDHIFPAYLSAKKWKIPFICMPLIHQRYPELFLTSIKLTMLSDSDSIIVLSKSEKNLLVNHKIEQEKISIIPPTVIPMGKEILDTENFKISNLPNFSGKTVLFVGVKSASKGIIHLINAMKLVWKKNPKVKLILIGPSSPEFDEFFLKLPQQYKLKILDLGIVNEKRKYEAISICDIFVLPSISESFGLVYIEAWLYKKPVIGCTLPSVSEIIENKKNGLLVEFGNIQELEASISFLLENPDICKKFGEEGNRKSSSFTNQENLKKFEKLCETLVFRSKP